jgi:archaeosine synthase
MSIFFELLEKKVGFSRIGRIILSKSNKKYVSTPNLVVPIKIFLMNLVDFLQDLENHEIFIISNEIYLKIGFLRSKFKNKAFIYTHYGSIERFEEILEANLNIFSEDNIIPLISFNYPTTSLSRDFIKTEIQYYLQKADLILSKHKDLNFGLSIRLFDHVDLFELYLEFIEKHQNIHLLNFSDLFDYLNNFRDVARCISMIKGKLDNNLVIMASGKIKCNIFPIMTYLGIDLVDASFLLYLASEGYYETIEYLLPAYKIKYLPCSCAACRGKLKDYLSEKYSSKKTKLISIHNLNTAKDYMYKLKQFMQTEDFRFFVEKSSKDNTSIISLLKILDLNYYDSLKFETPIMQPKKMVKSIGACSYHRPDFRYFRDRVIETFEPEPWTKLIILFPCSAKKPYSQSKSHRKFLEILRKFPEFPDFQEIILTSPLGAIPRQLENVYPANSYDISVTGHWNREELQITQKMLLKLIRKYDPEIPILSHLPEKGYSHIVHKVIKKVPNTIFFTQVNRSLISKDSLNDLQEKIRNLKNKYPTDKARLIEPNLSKTWFRKLSKIIDFEYGPNVGRLLLKGNIKIHKNRKAGLLEILDQDDKSLLGKFYEETGKVILSINAANRIGDLFKDRKFLVFNGEKISGSTLFRPGILEYSEDLIPGSSAIVWNETKDRIIAVVEMIVGGNFMNHAKSGRIAFIYEKL